MFEPLKLKHVLNFQRCIFDLFRYKKLIFEVHPNCSIKFPVFNLQGCLITEGFLNQLTVGLMDESSTGNSDSDVALNLIAIKKLCMSHV